MKPVAAVFAHENRPLWFAGAAVFLCASVATAPASLIASAVGASVPQAHIGGANGTVWRGTLEDVYVNDIRLGRIYYRLAPLHALTGKLAADLSADGGALTGKGRIAVGPGAYSIGDLSVRFNLASIRRYTFFGVPYQGEAIVRAKKISFGSRRCAAADASLSTNMLDGLSRQWSQEPLTLEGPIECPEGSLSLSLSGGNRAGRLTLSAAVTPQMAYSITVTAASVRPEFGVMLRSIGFEGDDAQLMLKAAGQLKGISS